MKPNEIVDTHLTGLQLTNAEIAAEIGRRTGVYWAADYVRHLRKGHRSVSQAAAFILAYCWPELWDQLGLPQR